MATDGKHNPVIVRFYITGGTGIINKDSESGNITTQNDVVKFTNKYDLEMMLPQMRTLGYDRAEVVKHGEIEAKEGKLTADYYEPKIEHIFAKKKKTIEELQEERIKALEAKLESLTSVDKEPSEKEKLQNVLNDAGIEYKKTLGLEKLKELAIENNLITE